MLRGIRVDGDACRCARLQGGHLYLSDGIRRGDARGAFGPFLNVIARHECVKGVQRQRERALRQVMVSGVGHRGRHVVSGGIRHHRRRGVDGQRILLPVLGEGRMRGNV